ncbi:MAG: 4-(cytidine 5'-diphospho)-2-C-methyl-D-erythritol kinase [Cytophagales bacterium]|nr:4-(cytidine 5'-diphospho)-2-C-methyl-D-erythritol kinase [Cytophagales bacterium]MDW8385078.1 4-(cytidine 5'-diphospho)-2-C-methyl-D-erythritol kinase [Flammeovirgaceae bacterium]
MISFPNAKINLGLHILHKRPDNYHEIDSFFVPVPWCDILEITPSQRFEWTNTGLAIDAKPEENLCVKAYLLIKEKYQLPPVRIHLHKVIPMGAGLGGGSSDGAFAIKMLNELFSLQMTLKEQQQFATYLGSDCSFFIENKPAFVSGKGEILEVHPQNPLQNLWIVLIYPQFSVNTRQAYQHIVPQIPLKSCRDIIKHLSISTWKDFLKNDFEASVFKKYPTLASIKTELYEKGAIYASMTGSGSSIYGIFHQKIDISSFSQYLVWQGKIE